MSPVALFQCHTFDRDHCSSSLAPPSSAQRARHINQLHPPATEAANNIETCFFGHIIRRDPNSVLLATNVLDSTNTYSRPSSVPSRPSLSSVSCGARSPYPSHVPPARQTAKTWITPQRSVSVPVGTISNHYRLGFNAELQTKQTSCITFISATAVDPPVEAACLPVDV